MDIPERLLQLKPVLAQTGLGRSTLFKLMKRKNFPLNLKVGSRSLWVQSEVNAWITAQIAGRK
jgi:prophage regulatory protein